MSYRLFWIIGLLLLTACSNPITSDRRQQSLDKTLWSYEQSMRWDELYKIWSFQSESVRQQHPPPEGLENIQVTGYEQLERPLPLEDGQIQVIVRIRYIERDRQVVRERIDRQLWEYHSASNRWLRSNPVPHFTR